MESTELSWIIPHPASDTEETASVKTIDDREH